MKPAKARFSEGVCNGVPKENEPRVSGRKGSSIRRVGFLSLLRDYEGQACHRFEFGAYL